MNKVKRIFHTWDKWECYPAGFYENSKEGMTKQECEAKYRDFLSDLRAFDYGLTRVLFEWPNSCEHYLTNEKMNRIAWLGQAALCLYYNIPSCFRSGYFLLTQKQREDADKLALSFLNKWLVFNGYEPTTLEGAGVNAQANIY